MVNAVTNNKWLNFKVKFGFYDQSANGLAKILKFV